MHRNKKNEIIPLTTLIILHIYFIYIHNPLKNETFGIQYVIMN